MIGQDELKELRDELADQRRAAEEKELQLDRYASDLRETFKAERARADELRRSYVATVRALTNAVEARDAYTGKHAERVAAYGLELAKVVDPALAGDPEIEFGFLLHDVGKVGVPDAILHKPSGLSRREQGLMRRHPVLGWEIVRHMEFLHGSAQQIVRFHHERWDGDGYPDRLAGSDIPLPARIFSVADTIDAITTDRPYRPATSLDNAREEIATESGRQFDPQAVAALMEIPDDLLDHIRTESVLTSTAAP